MALWVECQPGKLEIVDSGPTQGSLAFSPLKRLTAYLHVPFALLCLACCHIHAGSQLSCLGSSVGRAPAMCFRRYIHVFVRSSVWYTCTSKCASDWSVFFVIYCICMYPVLTAS